MTELLTLADVAAKLRVSERTVRRWVAEGRLRVIRPGRKPLVTERELDHFVAGLDGRRSA